MNIPEDVQRGIERIYGPDELARRIAECDQREAAVLEEINQCWHPVSTEHCRLVPGHAGEHAT